MRLPLLLALVLIAGCSSSNRVIAPIAPEVSLPTASPQSVGLNADRLGAIAQQIASKDDHDLHSMLILRNGKVAFEEYYNGHSADNPHDIRSATKSITALLAGIAIARGDLPSVDAPMMDYLASAYPDADDKADITVGDLLTMSSGMDCDDGDRQTRGQEDRMYRSKDWTAYFLALDRAYPPGDSTRYCTGGVVALGEVIAQATGSDFAAFADDALFRPLGITNYRWARYDDGRKVDTGGHLLLTPQAMAKIGLLVLQNGQWNGEQIVPAEWIAQATTARTRINGSSYGYLWWSDTVHYGDRTVDIVWASGNGGQTIFLAPEFDLAAVFTAGYYNSDRTRVVFELFSNGVLPAVEEIRAHLLKAERTSGRDRATDL